MKRKPERQKNISDQELYKLALSFKSLSNALNQQQQIKQRKDELHLNMFAEKQKVKELAKKEKDKRKEESKEKIELRSIRRLNIYFDDYYYNNKKNIWNSINLIYHCMFIDDRGLGIVIFFGGVQPIFTTGVLALIKFLINLFTPFAALQANHAISINIFCFVISFAILKVFTYLYLKNGSVQLALNQFIIQEMYNKKLISFNQLLNSGIDLKNFDLNE